MKITEQNRKPLIGKLEFKYKSSEKGKALIERINNDDDFTIEELRSATNKLEYKFKKSERGQALIQAILG